MPTVITRKQTVKSSPSFNISLQFGHTIPVILELDSRIVKYYTR
jgi:hypothetical protein